MTEIQVKTMEPQTVMSLSFTGAYEQTSHKLDELIGWLLRDGHPYCAPPLCVYYDDPEKAPENELRAEACLPIAEQCRGDRDVVRKSIPGGQFACAVHEGPYSGIGSVYKQIFSWMAQNGYLFVENMGTREVFLRLPGEPDAPGEPLTEVQVPVEKAQ